MQHAAAGNRGHAVFLLRIGDVHYSYGIFGTVWRNAVAVLRYIFGFNDYSGIVLRLRSLDSDYVISLRTCHGQSEQDAQSLN